MSVETINKTEIPSVWISVSNKQNDTNPSGFKYTEINTKEDLENSLKYDHLFCEVKDGYRDGKNFTQTGVLWGDIDNNHEDQDKWVTIEDFKERFNGYRWILYTSKSHRIEKDGKKPRDKFHVMFPMDSLVKNGEEVKELHSKLYESWSGVFDESVKDPSHFFFGTDDCCKRVEYNLDGECITKYIQSLKTPSQSINPSTGSSWGEMGKRNTNLTSIGGFLRNKFNPSEVELNSFLLKMNETFYPPLPRKEVETITRSLSKYPSNHVDKFWIEDEKTGLCKSIDVTSLMEDFFTDRGFGSFVVNEGIFSGKDKGTQGDCGISVIKKNGNVISHFSGGKQKQYLSDYLKDINRKDVRSVLDKQKTWYSEIQQLSIGRMDIEFLMDSPEKCFLYFQNGVVEITKDSIELINWEHFEMGDKYIWESQKKNRDVQIIKEDQWEDGDFEEFIKLSMSTEKDSEWKMDEEELKSFKSSYGYMIHDYKDKSEPKLILYIDKESSGDKSGGEGGTGKSLVMGSIKHYKSFVQMEGDGIGSSTSFGFTDVDLDTKFLEIDDVDVNKNTSPIRDLYSKITGDFTVDKKYGKKFTIPFETSPKIGLTSNHPIGGVSSSSDRRYHVVEFSSYWNRQLKIHGTVGIKKHFGRRLFDEWDETEWNRFYNFGFQCIQEYLKNGLYVPVRENYKRRQLLREMDEETHNWIVMWIEQECPKLDEKGEEFDVLLPRFHMDTRNVKVNKKELKKHMKLVSETYGHKWVTNTIDGRLLHKINGVTTECVYVQQSFRSRIKQLSKNIFKYIGISEKYPWE